MAGNRLLLSGEVREWLKLSRVAGVSAAEAGGEILERRRTENGSQQKQTQKSSVVRRGEVREWLKRSASKADIP